MNLINVKQLPSMNDDEKMITSITFSQDESICNMEIVHSKSRIVYSWRITNPECDLKFTSGQITMLLHKGLDLISKGKPYYSDVVVTDEDREKFERILLCVMKRLHLYYSSDQKFHCEVRNSNELYQEMNYILTE